MLYKAAVGREITFRLGCPVVDIDDQNIAVVIKGGERIEADLIIGADGKSTMNALQAIQTQCRYSLRSFMASSIFGFWLNVEELRATYSRRQIHCPKEHLSRFDDIYS